MYVMWHVWVKHVINQTAATTAATATLPFTTDLASIKQSPTSNPNPLKSIQPDTQRLKLVHLKAKSTYSVLKSLSQNTTTSAASTDSGAGGGADTDADKLRFEANTEAEVAAGAEVRKTALEPAEMTLASQRALLAQLRMHGVK